MRPVVILAPTLSGNALGRANVFVDLLAGHRPVVLAGPGSGRPWVPAGGRAAVETLVPDGRLRPSRRLRHALDGATAIVIKPLFSSLGQRLLARVPGPWILDIDDPELALATADARTMARSLLTLDGPHLSSLLLTQRWRASAITVASTALLHRYGGTVIAHARESSVFTPGVRDRAAARQALGLHSGRRLVAFVGTPRSHKGISTLIAAAPMIGADIVIVGATRPLAGPSNVRVEPPAPYLEAMRWIAAADVVVVPQRSGRIAELQAPAKAVDALAMGRAIVASDVPPVREMIDAAGILIPPDSPAALAEGVSRVLSDPDLRHQLEAAARDRFEANYSVDAVRPALLRILEEIET